MGRVMCVSTMFIDCNAEVHRHELAFVYRNALCAMCCVLDAMSLSQLSL